MEISIVIPIHNAAKYLNRCLESVLEAIKMYDKTAEIILIDNNSTDKSLEITESFCKKHPKMTYVLQCNTEGASAARNLGTEKAKGKYVWFIDADDYIDKTAISKLMGEAEQAKADLVMMGAKRISREGEISYLSAVDPSDKNYKSRFIRYGMGPWQVLIRRKWWNENGFRFKEGIIQEDMEIMSALILYTDRFASVDEPLYFYCDNPESVLHKEKFNPHIFDIFPALKGLYGRFKTAKAEKKYKDELEWFFIWNLLIDSAKDFEKFPEGKSGFKRSREMLLEYFPEWRKNKFLKQKSLKLRARVRLNYLKKIV